MNTSDGVKPATPAGDALVAAIKRHPKLRNPTLAAMIAWIVLLVGGGILLISEHRANNAIAKVHNFSACTLRLYLVGVRDRAIATSNDASLSKSARERARSSLSDLNTLIASQRTTPTSYDCARVIPQRDQGHKT